MNNMMEKIKELYNQEKYSECISMADDVLKNQDNDIDALSYKAGSLSHLGNYNEAVEVFSKCIELDKNRFYLWVLRGDAYEELKDYRKAFDDYWRSIQLEPNNGAVLDKMARILFNFGNENSALEYIKKAVDVGNSPEPLLVMMAMLNKMGMYGFLHELYEVGIAKFPEQKEQFERYRSVGLFK